MENREELSNYIKLEVTYLDGSTEVYICYSKYIENDCLHITIEKYDLDDEIMETETIIPLHVIKKIVDV